VAPGHFFGMTRRPPTIDMLPDGTFRTTYQGLPFSTKLMIGGAIVAALAGSVVIGMLALWLVTMLIPVVMVAALIAYVVYRVKRWRSGGQPEFRNGPLTPR